jgi:hypothetical protein
MRRPEAHFNLKSEIRNTREWFAASFKCATYFETGFSPTVSVDVHTPYVFSERILLYARSVARLGYT